MARQLESVLSGIARPRTVVTEYLGILSKDETEAHDLLTMLGCVNELLRSKHGERAVLAVCCAVLNDKVVDTGVLCSVDSDCEVSCETINSKWVRGIVAGYSGIKLCD